MSSTPLPVPILSATCSLPFAADHSVFAGHFPNQPIIPGALLIDMAIVAIETATHCTIAQIQQAKFLSPATPGEPLELRYQGQEKAAEYHFTCHVYSGERLIASARLQGHHD